MLKLIPDIIFESITDITEEVLEKENIHALILDIDNTLAPRKAEMPDKKIAAWIEELKAANVKLYIISNNHKNRVAKISENLGLPFHCNSLKPFPHSFKSASRAMNVPLCEIAAVGDQIFTDVLGARFSGTRAWLVNSLEEKESVSLRIRRFFEKPLVNKYYTLNGGKKNEQ